MAVEKNAVREGTRWDLRGRVVVVEEVTSRSVIFHDAHGCKTEVMTLDRFLEQAADPLRAEHTRLMDGLLHATHGQPSDSPMGRLLSLLRDAAVYQLERTYPGSVPYVEPAPAAPRAEPAPVVVEAEPLCTVADEPLEDYAIPMPDYEPPRAKKRRF